MESGVKRKVESSFGLGTVIILSVIILTQFVVIVKQEIQMEQATELIKVSTENLKRSQNLIKMLQNAKEKQIR